MVWGGGGGIFCVDVWAYPRFAVWLAGSDHPVGDDVIMILER